MSSHGYSTFLVFGSGCAAGLTTRTYIAASAAGAPVTSSTNGTNVRCSCDFRKNGVSVIWMSVGRRLPGHHAVDQLDELLDLTCSCLLRFCVSGLACCAQRDRQPATGRPQRRAQGHDV